MFDILLENNKINLYLLNNRRESVLFQSVADGYLHAVKQLVQTGVDICVMDLDSRNTLLHTAVKSRNDDIFNFLLKQNKIDVNAVNKKGETALELAVRKGCHDVFSQLIKINDIRVIGNKKNYKINALMIAASMSDLKMVKQIIESKRYDISQTDKFNRTCMHYALSQPYGGKEWNNEKILDILINEIKPSDLIQKPHLLDIAGIEHNTKAQNYLRDKHGITTFLQTPYYH